MKNKEIKKIVTNVRIKKVEGNFFWIPYPKSVGIFLSQEKIDENNRSFQRILDSRFVISLK